jgi:hypothetical protein
VDENETLNGVWDTNYEQDALIALFILWYGAMLKAIHTITLTMLNLGPVPLDDPAVKRMILQAQASAVVVDAQTRKLIAKRIADGTSRGLTYKEIAYGTADFEGIDGLFDVTWKSRAETVARTELQRAQLRATVDRFRQLGRGAIIGVRASDGDYDAACAARDGRVYPIGSEPDLLHPNCQLTLDPVYHGA